MLYSDHPRVRYETPQLAEVICQLRFPTILAIADKDPVDFQEAVRSMFPKYALRQERAPMKISNFGTPAARLEAQKPVTNHNFISSDNRWKLNLTGNFVALSTVAYGGWEDFGKRLDLPLAQFIRIYKPAYFERIGLRYVNMFSRRALGLEGEFWRDLIAAPYLGPLAFEDAEEDQTLKSSVDAELRLDGSCRVKIHAGPERMKRAAPGVPGATPETNFVLDMDLFMAGQLEPRAAAAGLETLHGHSTPLFQGAITDRLHTAMGPR